MNSFNPERIDAVILQACSQENEPWSRIAMNVETSETFPYRRTTAVKVRDLSQRELRPDEVAIIPMDKFLDIAVWQYKDLKPAPITLQKWQSLSMLEQGHVRGALKRLSLPLPSFEDYSPAARAGNGPSTTNQGELASWQKRLMTPYRLG